MNLLLLLLLVIVASVFGLAEAYLSNGLLSISITRHHKGDIFTAQGGKCYKDFCMSLSSGTAAATGNGDCECKCGANRPVFRDDVNTCVDDIEECSLVPFASGTAINKIPYVFLPLRGQIVHPSAEIVISGKDEETPVCVVSGGQFLGQSGWVKLRNSSGTESPFRLFRDEGRTYLQWLGESSMRMAMEGRIILVQLMCKDASAIEEPKIFTPCICFRVAGKPSVKEMTFTTDVDLKEEYGGGLSAREYVAIGVCSVLLAVVYVAAVALYLYIRRRKQKTGSQKSGKSASLTLGEEGVIKSNPLLQAARHIAASGQDNAGYVSESNSCCSDTDRTSDLLCLVDHDDDDDDHDDNDDDDDDDDDDDGLVTPQNMQTAALIHPCDLDYGETIQSQDPNNMEKLPEENVSIVETLEVREHPETLKGMSCGNGRRKLYFNPSYFEPDLLKAPPPAAMEFLIKIREVIAIAKHKMSAKKFSPSLVGIPEEENCSKTEQSSSLGGRKSDVKAVAPDAKPLGDFRLFDAKQKIIRKWLEDVPVMLVDGDQVQNARTSGKEGNGSPPGRQIRERRKAKGRAPPAPPMKAECKSENALPPRPPPLPAVCHDSDQVPRVQGKDFIPPAIAKNLMDAVIQELATFRKNDRNSNLKDLPGKLNETWQKSEEDAGAATAANVRGNNTTEDVVVPTADTHQDDHEYEIILLNAEQPSSSSSSPSEGKDMKIYNLPEILSKSDRSEGYSLVSEVYVNDGYSCCSSGGSPSSTCSNLSLPGKSDNVHYDVPNENPGRLTIHVNDSPPPQRYKTPDESDNFDPDTLDRKPPRPRLLTPAISRRSDDTDSYSNQKFHHMESHNNSDRFTDSLERRPAIPPRNDINDLLTNFTWNNLQGFPSLREIYQAKTRNDTRRKATTSLIDYRQTDLDRLSTLSWSEQTRHKLLHRGIVLHINHQATTRHRRTPKTPTQPPPSPAPTSSSASPNLPSNPASSPLPPPRSTSSPSSPSSPSPTPPPSPPKPPSTPPSHSHSHSPSPSPSPPPRPPKTNPLLPPRSTKPPLPPKTLKRPPKPGKFAGRPLPPLPRPNKHHDPDNISTLSASASIDSLNSSSDYEAFYTLPYTDPNDHHLPPPRPSSQKHPQQPPNPHRPEDSGYLSTDSDSCCPQLSFPPTHNSETDDSLCDGASESGGESIATDSFFYGNFNSKPGNMADDDREGHQVHPCALRRSDIELNTDADRHCVPIMVRP